MIGSSDSNRSEKQGLRPQGTRTEGSDKQRHDRRNTNRQRGRLRAMSVLVDTKSNRHRKTQKVEPDGTGRKFEHLTRGELQGQGSQQQSAEVIVVKKAGENRKERRTQEPRDRPTKQTLATGASSHPKQSRSNTECFLGSLKRGRKSGSLPEPKEGRQARSQAKEVQEGAE